MAQLTFYSVLSAEEKTRLQPSSVPKFRMCAFPPYPFLDNPLPALPHSLLFILQSSWEGGKGKELHLGFTQQKEHNTESSTPARYPHLVRAKGARGVLRRVGHCCLVHRDHHSRGTGTHFSLQESLRELVHVVFSPAPEQGCLTSQVVVI